VKLIPEAVTKSPILPPKIIWRRRRFPVVRKRVPLSYLQRHMLNEDLMRYLEISFSSCMQREYRISTQEIMTAESPGYWESKKPCGGFGVCASPLHKALFCSNGVRHTYTFFNRTHFKGISGSISPYLWWWISKYRENPKVWE